MCVLVKGFNSCDIDDEVIILTRAKWSSLQCTCAVLFNLKSAFRRLWRCFSRRPRHRGNRRARS